MSTLFNNNSQESGFRLQYFEIFNWGTFHGKVYRVQPNGKTSLLTGANRSGKTTLIDALLTLLVPTNKRFYNQSSGTDQKKDRDENSYFWGHFGKTFSEIEEKSKTEQLRSKSDNPYSVLLAYFQNSATLHNLTIAQIRWYNGEIKRAFLVSPHQLNINEHFGKGMFDVRGEWKKKLKNKFPKSEVFDTFKDYSNRFSEIFGLKENALSLFNQTVGIKVLGDLTQFIRQHMLEESEVEEQFKKLHDHYTDLLISHRAIQKDEKQLELLEPIVHVKSALEEVQEKLIKLNELDSQLPLFMKELEFDLLDKYISSLENECGQLERQKGAIESEIKGLEAQQKELLVQKSNLDIDRQVELMKQTINFEEREKNRKKPIFDDYVLLAGNLGLNTSISDQSFNENLQKINSLKSDLDKLIEKLSLEKFKLISDRENLGEEINRTQQNIDSYLKRKNRIPPELIAVRDRLLALLDAGDEELPFVGELIRVKETSHRWEDAIERVLHSFSLQLLVPEKYSKQVNYFINNNNLQVKLVYQKIDLKEPVSITQWPTEPEFLINNIELKSSSSYRSWLERQLLERFNYWCTDDLNVFYNSQKAITSKGLVRNLARHEKDDRPNRWNKIHYTLGWDNHETVKLLLEEKQKLEKKSEHFAKEIKRLTPEIGQNETRRASIVSLINIKSFLEINWQVHATTIATLNKQKDELLKSSNKYSAIEGQLSSVESLLGNAKEQRDTISDKISRNEEKLNTANTKKLNLDFEGLTDNGRRAVSEFVADIKNFELPVEAQNVEQATDYVKNLLKKQIKNEEHCLTTKSLEANTLINCFINPTEKVLKEFPDWSGDVMNIRPDLNSLDELEELFNKIKHQRLVEHKKRFRDYMDKSMIDALTSFRTWLVNEEDRIKEVIDDLNTPLKNIKFNKNPDTYLQLEYRSSKDVEIRDFKQKLNSTIPDALLFSAKKDESYRTEVFGKIRDLITELQKEESWRKKVIDVRNWLTFSAREYTVEDHKATQYHDNTASYSGGQKAQFTYAILGAAIAHQFGIFQAGKQYKSLRFISVDEAFSKLDPDNSQFLMEYCSQLNLQLLVVTPLDKINIAEPYINAVHYVEIKNKKNSIVYNLTMEEYQQRKEEFKQLAEQTA